MGTRVRDERNYDFDGDGNIEPFQFLADVTIEQFNLHAGADSDEPNKITVEIENLSSSGLGVNKIHSNWIGIVDDTGDLATDMIDVAADALKKVSTQRSLIGAMQNRLEHTIRNLDNVVENTTQAESNIRDTDMAEEMVTYSNNSVLLQAGQSMLAQANQANQGILPLLGDQKIVFGSSRKMAGAACAG